MPKGTIISTKEEKIRWLQQNPTLWKHHEPHLFVIARKMKAQGLYAESTYVNVIAWSVNRMIRKLQGR